MNILFLCTGNSCRSIIAEALLKSVAPAGMTAQSAGSKPAGYVHPRALAALQKAGISIGGFHSKSWDNYRRTHYCGDYSAFHWKIHRQMGREAGTCRLQRLVCPEFTFSVSGAKRNKPFAAFLCLLITAISVAGNVIQARQVKTVPYIIEVDNLGQIGAVARADTASSTPRRLIQASIASCITDWRTVTVDVELQRKMIERLSFFIAGSRAKPHGVGVSFQPGQSCGFG